MVSRVSFALASVLVDRVLRGCAVPSVSARRLDRMCFCLDSDAVRCIRARYPIDQTDPDDECMCICHAADPEAGWDGKPDEPDDEEWVRDARLIGVGPGW